MDKSDVRVTTLRFGPDRRVTALAGGGALVALVLALLAGDATGRLLFGLACALLLAYVASDLIYTPRLVATAGGVAVRSPSTRVTLSWADIDAVRADTRSRFGLRSSTLEIDAGEVLAVFSRRSLGAEPDDVAALVNALRPPA